MIITDMGRGKEADAGLSFLKKLNSLHCQIPVIFYTSFEATKRYGEEAHRLGAYAVINGIGDIISVISDVLGL